MLEMNINSINKYDFNSKKFRIAYEFLKNTDLNEIPVGRYELEEGVYAMVSEYNTLPASERKFETHNEYYDIQCIVSGQENIVLTNRKVLKEAIPYDPVKDVTFYEEPSCCGGVGLYAGDFLIVTPEDAHKPHCDLDGEHDVKKVVIKVPLK